VHSAANVERVYTPSLRALMLSVWNNRELIWRLTIRDVLSRYRGSAVGLGWSFFNPLLMLCVYTFVFSVIFQSRWLASGVVQDSKAEFAVVVFAGMIIHGFFAECLSRAPGLILANVNYVKKVVFPLEILPLVAVGSALFHATISLFVLLLAQLTITHTASWTSLLSPVIFFPLILGTTGVTWIFASLGVYVRDLGQTIGILIAVLLFFSPVFYPITALPLQYRFLLLLNPLTFIIEQVRNVLIWNQQPDWAGWLIYCCLSLLVAWLGFWWFQRTRMGFADVV
jgi:lipopolysaccharide transport system permease protein